MKENLKRIKTTFFKGLYQDERGEPIAVTRETHQAPFIVVPETG